MSRLLMIGAVGAGKSSLTKVLTRSHHPVNKTQSLIFYDWIIDTPGEYSENPLYYRALMATSLEAKMLLIVHDATNKHLQFPPGFASGFPLPAIGVLTKIDHPQADVFKAEAVLRQALPQGEIWHTSSFTNAGIDELRTHLMGALGAKKF